jgi:ferritin-like metal-binding protein YciE
MHLVSDREGILKNTPKHLEKLNSPKFDENGELSEISHFESLFRWAGKYGSENVGEIIEKTINLHTTAGFALLIHPDKKIVDNDYFDIIELQKSMYETE